MSEPTLPDPNGKPIPAQAGFGVVDAIALVAATGVCLFLLGALMTPTLGGTQSSRLQWEERQRKTEEAVRAAALEEGEQKPVESPTGEPQDNE